MNLSGQKLNLIREDSLSNTEFNSIKVQIIHSSSSYILSKLGFFGLMEASWNRLISPDSKTKLKIQKIPNSIIFWWLLSIRPLFQGCSWTVLHGKTDCNTRFNRHFWAHESYSKLPDFTKSKTEPSSAKILGLTQFFTQIWPIWPWLTTTVVEQTMVKFEIFPIFSFNFKFGVIRRLQGALMSSKTSVKTFSTVDSTLIKCIFRSKMLIKVKEKF